MTARTTEVHLTTRTHYGWRFRLAPLINRLPLGLRRRAARAVIRHARIDIFAGESRLAHVLIEPEFQDDTIALHPVLGPRSLP